MVITEKPLQAFDITVATIGPSYPRTEQDNVYAVTLLVYLRNAESWHQSPINNKVLSRVVNFWNLQMHEIRSDLDTDYVIQTLKNIKNILKWLYINHKTSTVNQKQTIGGCERTKFKLCDIEKRKCGCEEGK